MTETLLVIGLTAILMGGFALIRCFSITRKMALFHGDIAALRTTGTPVKLDEQTAFITQLRDEFLRLERKMEEETSNQTRQTQRYQQMIYRHIASQKKALVDAVEDPTPGDDLPDEFEASEVQGSDPPSEKKTRSSHEIREAYYRLRGNK